MSQPLLSLLSIMIALAAPSWMAAKGRTVRITLTGLGQSKQVEITNAAVSQFHVWDGPGTYINGVPQKEGFIADWAKGRVAQPQQNLRRYQIAFYTGCKMAAESACNSDEPQLSYVVIYGYDEAAKQGYVYLPGREEPWYQLNTRSILRQGLEGNWFEASSNWQRFLTSFLAQVQ